MKKFVVRESRLLKFLKFMNYWTREGDKSFDVFINLIILREGGFQGQ